MVKCGELACDNGIAIGCHQTWRPAVGFPGNLSIAVVAVELEWGTFKGSLHHFPELSELSGGGGTCKVT